MKLSKTRRLIFVILFTALSVFVSSAQSKSSPVQFHLRAGMGPFLESGTYKDNMGLAVRLSAGVEMKLAENWSVLAGAGIREQISDIAHFLWVGSDPDGLGGVDVHLAARYRINAGNSAFILGLGPQVTFVTEHDTYYVDHDPNDPIDGQRKFLPTDYGIQPSIYYELGKHWEFGVEGCIGLRNMRIQYPEHHRTGTTRMHTILFVAGFRF